MGVVEKLKRLHKQDSISLADIRAVSLSGVDVGKYMSMARTLKSYLSVKSGKDSSSSDSKTSVHNEKIPTVDKEQKISSKKNSSKSKTFKM